MHRVLPLQRPLPRRLPGAAVGGARQQRQRGGRHHQGRGGRQQQRGGQQPRCRQEQQAVLQVAPRFVLPQRVAQPAHALGHLGIGHARPVGAAGIGAQGAHREVMRGHRRVDVGDLPAPGAQAGAQLGLLAGGQGRVEAVHLGQRGAAHQHITAEVQRFADRVHPVQVQHPGVDRLLRRGLAAVAPHCTPARRVDGRVGLPHEAGVQLGVAVEKQHHGATGLPPAQVAALGRIGRGIVEHQHGGAQALGDLHAAVGRS